MIKVKDTKNQVIVGPVRFSYLNVWKPKLNKNRANAVPKFTATLLFPKIDCEQQPKAIEEIEALKEMIMEQIEAKWGKGAGKGIKKGLRDGDSLVGADGEPCDPKHPGYFYLEAKANEEYPPQVIDGAKRAVGANAGWASGDWGYVKISAYPYEVDGSKGISFGLRAVQFTIHDEQFVGASGNVDDFPEVAVPVPQTATGFNNDDYDPFADE